MAASLIDFIKGVDFTGEPNVQPTNLNNLVDAAIPYSDKGLIVATVDIAGVPSVPNAAVTTKWVNYMWLRITATTVIAYLWNPNAAVDATYLKWANFSQISIAPNSITQAMLQDNIINDAKVLGISASKISGLPSAFPPNGAAGGSLAGTYPNPTIAPLTVAGGGAGGQITAASITDYNIANVGITPGTASGKLALGTAKYILQMNDAGTQLDYTRNYFAELHTLGTGFQSPRVNTGATALEWVNTSVLQRLIKGVATTTGVGSIPFDSTIPQIGEGDALVAAQTITPKLTTSLLRVRFTATISCGTAANIVVALFKDSGADAVGACFVNISAANVGQQVNIDYFVASGSTAATTFSVRIGTSTGTYAVNRGSSNTLGSVVNSYLIMEEVDGTLTP